MDSGARRDAAVHPSAGRQQVLRWAAYALVAAALFGVVTDLAPPVVPLPLASATLALSPMGSAVGRPASPEPWVSIRPIPVAPVRRPSLTGHIRIPAIGVDAPLIPLGFGLGGTLEVPKDWEVTGWFRGGPFPGEPGPAVVVGHVDSTRGPAVFYRLRDLRPGDLIVVSRTGGTRSHFRVVSLEWVSKSAFPTRRVYGAVTTPALRLITCGGVFDRTTRHYVDNLIVFAVPAT